MSLSDCRKLLTVVSVVELTVGIMCSCLTSFPGFFRYHLPLFKSIVSIFNSSFRSLRSSKHSQSITPNSAQRLATSDVKVTLGSRVDGKGLFMNPESAFATERDPPLPPSIARGPSGLTYQPGPTRREYYEDIAECPSLQYPPSIHDHSTQLSTSSCVLRDEELGVPTPSASQCEHSNFSRIQQSRFSRIGWWKRPRHSDGARTGYWEVMSFFRTGNVESPIQSKSASEGQSLR